MIRKDARGEIRAAGRRCARLGALRARAANAFHAAQPGKFDLYRKKREGRSASSASGRARRAMRPRRYDPRHRSPVRDRRARRLEPSRQRSRRRQKGRGRRRNRRPEEPAKRRERPPLRSDKTRAEYEPIWKCVNSLVRVFSDYFPGWMGRRARHDRLQKRKMLVARRQAMSRLRPIQMPQSPQPSRSESQAIGTKTPSAPASIARMR